MEREIPDKKNYTQNFCIPRKVGLFSFKFQIILFHSPLEISRNSTAIFHRMESARSVVEKNDVTIHFAVLGWHISVQIYVVNSTVYTGLVLGASKPERTRTFA